MSTIADRHAKARIKSIEDDIQFWRREAREAKSDVWMIALGVAFGLSMARNEWMGRTPDERP